MLKPLVNLMSSKVKFEHTDVEQKDFKDIKLIGTENTLLTYP